ncbi:MAG: glycosyltransferase family 4 protein [Chitinophagaceae bacterium]|jgi:glycosyltransferase involved in cell wall biosynthesis
MKKLAIITTHPIQYNAPLFRLLSERKQISVKVYYTWGQSAGAVFDARFGIERSWDIPLLEGYEYEFVNNTSKNPDSNRFWGIINPGLLKQLKNEHYDAVMIYRWSVWSHFYLMQKLGQQVKLFFRGDSTLLNKKKGIVSDLKNIWFQFVYRNVQTAFAAGTHNKAYLLKCGLKNEQIVDAPHAVDNKRFTENEEAMELRALKERRLMGIEDEALIFHYAGKFYGLKQLDILIKAFQLTKDKNVRLLLTGNGEDEVYLKSLAASDSRILFQSFKNQSAMPWVYRMGDVFVLPSKSETWGLGVNEAMACGRPAIVSNQCGCAPDLILEGKTGYVFKTGNESDLLRCLHQFSSHASVKEMQPFIKEHIARFSLENVAEAIEREVMREEI